MTRVKRGAVKTQHRQRMLKVMQGAQGAHSRLSRLVKGQAVRKMVYASRHRNLRKRDFRALWITRINAAARANGMTYSQVLRDLHQSHILLNRKMLAQMAVLDMTVFQAIINTHHTAS